MWTTPTSTSGAGTNARPGNSISYYQIKSHLQTTKWWTLMNKAALEALVTDSLHSMLTCPFITATVDCITASPRSPSLIETPHIKEHGADIDNWGGGDSSVVRAPDSWLKGRGFESLLERRENFQYGKCLSLENKQSDKANIKLN